MWLLWDCFVFFLGDLDDEKNGWSRFGFFGGDFRLFCILASVGSGLIDVEEEEEDEEEEEEDLSREEV